MDANESRMALAKIIDDCKGDVDLIDLRDEMFASAVRYARKRVDWYFSSRDERRAMDKDRSRAHDAFISSCDALSRNMVKRNHDCAWRQKLGEDRKVVGDFACEIHAYLGVLAR